MKSIINYLKKNHNNNVSMFLQDEDKTLKIIINDGKNYEIVFPNAFPNVPPVIQCNGKFWDDSGWEKNGSISQMFIEYFRRGNQYDR